MHTVTLEEAQKHLAEIIEKLTPGEEIVLTRDNSPVARLVGEKKPPRAAAAPSPLRRRPGACRQPLDPGHGGCGGRVGVSQKGHA